MKRLGLILVCLFCAGSTGTAQPVRQPIDEYVFESWSFLERTLSDLVKAAEDPKLGELDRYPVYIAPTESFLEVERRLRKTLEPAEFARLELRVLPSDVLVKPQLDGGIANQGLLYLPHSYVVPGGRFNEMYGWDSYFINLGLLESGKIQQAKLMVENHLYQVRHYGRVLNANRTYYLTRSQPPFLATMVKDVYAKTGDLDWVRASLTELESTYEYWTTGSHLTPETGLSRYYDLGDGPAPEVLASEKDESGQTHYDRIRTDFLKISKLSPSEQKKQLGYPLALYFDVESEQLTPLFYKGDRSMRESGYDPSDRFGRFNVDVIHYNPVDLNSLLYLYEQDMSWLLKELEAKPQAAQWAARAKTRAERMHTYLWDEEAGQFFDYNFRTKVRRDYPFATTYFPLWTKWANPQQAARIATNSSLFSKPGGVVTSTNRSGNQWDAPFGWAPLQLVAVHGLAHYGYDVLSDNISQAFCSLVEQEYELSGTIVEKYDVVARSSNVSAGIDFGYSSNEIGFGWTNAVYLKLKKNLANTP